MTTEADATAHLRLVADHLATGGVYVVGLHMTDYDDASRSEERWNARLRGADVEYRISSRLRSKRDRLEKWAANLRVRNRGELAFRTRSAWDARTYNVRQFKSLVRKETRFALVDTLSFDLDFDQAKSAVRERLDKVFILQRV